MRLTNTSQLISVVVPMYNVGKTLNRCLVSICAQTHSELQVICVNDGSTDGTLSLARTWAERDERVQVIDKPNGGYGAACNTGMAAAQGDWVAIVEPDDELLAGFYQALIDCAARCGGKRPDVVKGAYWRVVPAADGQGEKRMRCPYFGRVKPNSQPFPIEEGAELLLHQPAIWTALYARDYLEEKGIRFVEAPGSAWTDNPFMAETLFRTKAIAYVDAPGYVYYERDLNEARSFAERFPLVPLTRWNEMTDVADEAGVSDPRVLEALALRGINYALITLEAQGASDLDDVNDPEVKALIEKTMARINTDAALGSSLISPSGKALFCRVHGLDEPKGKLYWYAHLASEACYRVRTGGLGEVVGMARSRKGNRLG